MPQSIDLGCFWHDFGCRFGVGIELGTEQADFLKINEFLTISLCFACPVGGCEKHEIPMISLGKVHSALDFLFRCVDLLRNHHGVINHSWNPLPKHESSSKIFIRLQFLENVRAFYTRPERLTHQPIHYLMTHGDEIYAVAIRDADALQESASKGVEWLDTQRRLLQEWNDVDRHTLPVTGDLVED